MSYKISIIIPIYNLKNHITNTLDSILRQTIGFENLEIIMVNDCSTDGTGKILNNYSKKYKNFININLSKNSGLPGKPRNIGLEKATGEYIMFMDHDDFYAEDACEKLYNKITQENVDMVFCNYNNIFDNGEVKKNISIYKDEPELKIKKIEEDIRFLSLSPAIWTKIFKRLFLLDNNIKFPEGILAEDLSFVLQTLLNAEGIIYINSYYGYNYRIRNSEEDKSTIHIRNKKYLHSMILGYTDTYNILKKEKKEKYFPVIFEGHLEYWMNCFISGNTTQLEKMELLEEIVFLFEKQAKFGFRADESCLLLFDKIKNKEFDKAILISELSSLFRKQEIILKDKNRKLEEQNKKLERQLNSKKNQVAKLQTVKGWSNYKTKNIANRLNNKIKK